MKKWSEENIQKMIKKISESPDMDIAGVLVIGEMLQQLLDERRWIPVSKLPEIGKRVLLSVEYTERDVVEIGTWDGNYWLTSQGMEIELMSTTVAKVKGWKPLPPPKEEG